MWLVNTEKLSLTSIPSDATLPGAFDDFEKAKVYLANIIKNKLSLVKQEQSRLTYILSHLENRKAPRSVESL